MSVLPGPDSPDILQTLPDLFVTGGRHFSHLARALTLLLNTQVSAQSCVVSADQGTSSHIVFYIAFYIIYYIFAQKC